MGKLPDWLIKLIKNLLFKDIVKDYESEKDKPLYERKRTIGSAILGFIGLYAAYSGEQLDPALVNQFVAAVFTLIDSVKQMIDIIVQSKPLIGVAYGAALVIIGFFNAKVRQSVENLFGSPTLPPVKEIKAEKADNLEIE